MNLIKQHKSKLISLCKKYKVSELYVFGSVLTELFNKQSDIDFLVKFGDVELYDYFDNYMDFKESLESLFKRNVDLLEIQTLKNPILRRSIDRTKIKIYGRADSKMAV
ncbi:MAG: nucleotidyltransferase domain-containing protein [Bacteroidales bacterium]|nr:nucleotidyltransferase domain-containing protein [Bacteroidales bacterium]